MSVTSELPDLGVVDRSRAARINIAASYASIALAMIQGVVMVPLYLSRLGVGAYGAWLVTGNVVGWLAVVDPGFSSILQQQVAAAAGANNRPRVERLLGAALGTAAGMVGLVLAAGFALWPVMRKALGTSGEVPGIAQAFAVMVVATALMLGYYVIAGVFLGLQATGLLAVFYTASGIIGVVATAVGLLSGWGVSALAIGRLLTALILLVTTTLLFALHLRRKLHLRVELSRAVLRELAVQAKFTVLAKAVGVAASNMDAVMLSWWVGSGEAVMLNLNRKAADICAMMVDRIGTAIMPGLAHQYGAGDRAGFASAMRKIVIFYVVVLTTAAGGVLALNRLFVTTWVGEERSGSLGLTAAIVCAMVALQLSGLLSNLYLSTGKIAQTSMIGVADTATRVLALFLLLAAGVRAPAVPLAILLASSAVSIPYYLVKMRWALSGLFAKGAGAAASLALTFTLAFWASRLSLGAGWARLVLAAAGYLAIVLGAALALMPELRVIAAGALGGLWRRLRKPRGGPETRSAA